MPDREKLIEEAVVEIADYLPGDDEWQVEARACAERVVAVILTALSEEHLGYERVVRAAKALGGYTDAQWERWKRAVPGMKALGGARAALEAAGPVVVERERGEARAEVERLERLLRQRGKDAADAEDEAARLRGMLSDMVPANFHARGVGRLRRIEQAAREVVEKCHADSGAALSGDAIRRLRAALERRDDVAPSRHAEPRVGTAADEPSTRHRGDNSDEGSEG